jgi:signal transduction histidine kinase
MLTPTKSGVSPQTQRHLDTDWAICLLRWALIAGVPIIALFDPAHELTSSELSIFLGLASAYNLALTALLGLRLFPPLIPILTLIIDALGIVVLLHLSGQLASPFFAYPLFPVLMAALRLGWEYGFAMATLFIAGITFWFLAGWMPGDPAGPLFDPALKALAYVLAASGGGIISHYSATCDLVTSEDEHSLVPEQVKLIYEMASSLSATLNYERVLDAILDISRLGFDEFGHRMGEVVGMVLLYDKDGLLSVASQRNLYVQSDEAKRIPGRAGIVEQAISSAQSVIGESPANDPELGVFASLSRFRCMICVPLRAGFETYGVVLFASARPNAYTAEHAELLTIFCNQATIALQNASLYESLRVERDKIVDQEEQARHKLARNLHDGPTQDVAAIAMRLNFARLLIDRDPARARAELARLEDLAHRTVREIRSMLFTLRPVILETEGLVAALNQYADNLRETDGLSVEVDPSRYQDCLDRETQGVVFAILEEAINNAKKHAQATEIYVPLGVENGVFIAEVVDDGRGFDVDLVEQNYRSRGSLGLINLKERAELIEGTLKIESTPGRGTRVTLVVPLKEE